MPGCCRFYCLAFSGTAWEGNEAKSGSSPNASPTFNQNGTDILAGAGFTQLLVKSKLCRQRLRPGSMVETVHNPDRFMADLRQIMSQGRKRIGLLVGAGAPLAIRVGAEGKLDENGSPLIPGVDDLTQAAIANLDPKLAEVVEGIKAELGEDANIETILSRVRLLERALGPALVQGLDGAGFGNLGKNICENIGKIVSANLPAERCAYNELVSWINGINRSHPVEIFTTNYDLLFESAFEIARAPYFDGFSGGHVPFFDPVTVAGNDLPPRWSRLWKLHGSLGWALEDGAVVRMGGRESTQLVYPDYLKYDLTQKQPYSSLFERLKQFLLTPDTILLATGFSFRDAHICAVIDEALAQNANTAIKAFQYSNLEGEAPACKLAFNHPNMSVYASNGAVIGGIPGTWRPGDLPKNWAEIRATFWGRYKAEAEPSFLLGDFARFTRFCAQAQASDLMDTRLLQAVNATTETSEPVADRE